MNLVTKARSKFKVRTNLVTQTRSTFSVRMLLVQAQRATFKVQTKLVVAAQDTFKVAQVLASKARSKFKVSTSLRTQMQDTFSVRANLVTKTRGIFKVAQKLGTRAQDTFLVSQKLTTKARDKFFVRALLFTQAQATFVIDGLIALRTNPSAIPNQLGPFIYAGSNSVPISPPLFPYQVNGVVLRTQPSLLTAPTTIAGNVLQAGSLFVLVFNRPNGSTQSLLADGSTVTMTFGLPAGNMVTGQVLVSSALIGTSFQVVCTLVNPITINQYVIQTPFF